jgi:hypothetical protein
VNVNFPNTMSSLIGKDIRTGAQACFERVVIELQPGPASPTPSGFPGYRVEYVAKPLHLNPSDEVVSLRGAVALVVTMNSWMHSPDNQGYTGATDIVPDNVNAVKELRLIEDFEGQFAWAIGLDTQRNFRVSTLDAPARLVIDVQVTP